MRTILCGLMLVSLSGCADRMLLYPSTAPTDPVNAERRVVTQDEREIEVFMARSPGVKATGAPQAYVLEFTGNATRAEWVVNYIADRWGHRPVEVWVMNYPGFGGSTGPATLAAIPRSALAVYDALAQQANGKPIFLAGNSLGTTAALHVASKRPARGIILQNPPPLHRSIMQRHGWWNLGLGAGAVVLQIPNELNCLDTAKTVEIPAVFILAGRDELVLPEYQQMVVDAYAGEKRLIRMPEAGHNSPISGDAERQLQQELDWLWSGIVASGTEARILSPRIGGHPPGND